VGVIGNPSDAMATLLLRGAIGSKQRFAFHRDPAVTGDARPDAVLLAATVDHGVSGAGYEMFRVIESGVGITAVAIDGCDGVEEMLDEIEQGVREQIESMGGAANDVRIVRVDAAAYLRESDRWALATHELFEELDHLVTPRDLAHRPLLVNSMGEKELRSTGILHAVPQLSRDGTWMIQGQVLRGELEVGQAIDLFQPGRFRRCNVSRMVSLRRAPFDPPFVRAKPGDWIRVFVSLLDAPTYRGHFCGAISLRLPRTLVCTIRRGWSAATGFSSMPFEKGERVLVDSSPGWLREWLDITRIENLEDGQRIELTCDRGNGGYLPLDDGPFDNGRLSLWIRGERCGAWAHEINDIGY
jgi:uncharacterized protein YunC (DUF1805 family)